MRRAFIININSGNGISQSKINKWQRYFLKYTGDFNFHLPKNRKECISLTKSLLRKGVEQIIAIGGDGTANAVANGFFENGLPINPSTKAMTIRCLNKMYKWAYDNKLCRELKKIDGGSKWECRMRTFTENEMKLIMNEVTPHHFQHFVRFAYYTGARRSEIACLSEDNVREEYVSGKSGKRKIKLNSQARLILSKLDELWAYRPPYISQVFKKNLRRLNIKNGRFHDLRRTFGLNLIKQGMPIYEVSKLLGHASVRTTEKHYAPLLVTEIADFQL